MRPQDMQRFQSTMAALAEVFGKQLSPPLIDLYWEALKPLAIEQLQEGAQSWIRYGKHFPKPAELLERYREMEQAKPRPVPELEPPMPRWLCLVNGLFLKYLLKRRVDEMFRGDINLGLRREECLSLQAHMEALEAEFPEDATEDNLKILFAKAMARIPDRSPEPDWLAIQLEYQAKQDLERVKRRA